MYKITNFRLLESDFTKKPANTTLKRLDNMLYRNNFLLISDDHIYYGCIPAETLYYRVENGDYKISDFDFTKRIIILKKVVKNENL